MATNNAGGNADIYLRNDAYTMAVVINRASHAEPPMEQSLGRKQIRC